MGRFSRYQQITAVIRLLIILLIPCLSLSGCFLPGKSDFNSKQVKGCQYGQDQLGTFKGRWPSAPVPIALGGGFSNPQINEIYQAISTWNQHSSQNLNLNLLAASTSNTAISTVCNSSQAIISGKQFTGNVYILAQSQWSYSSSPNSIAITTVCTPSLYTPGSPLPYAYNAFIELNYQNFFTTTQHPDLQSIVAHELGHVLGLDHSCEGTAKNGIPNCSTPGLNPTYLSALMFPGFAFDNNGNGEIRRNLNSNDQGRINCLYEGY